MRTPYGYSADEDPPEGARPTVESGVPSKTRAMNGSLESILHRYFHMFAECECCGRRLRMPYGPEHPEALELKSISVPFCYCERGPTPSGIRIVLARPIEE